MITTAKETKFRCFWPRGTLTDGSDAADRPPID